ncbi:DUF2442 domain-containing protein [Aequorivita capsosiphonis]|uniref:DUF2442 domain-containing protein n=1 Tax=Aequorivita capsosiphonis TaxID=487317 RepID=UPI0003F67DE9|nr:DUF2442 domain-containing protein [Aequorivita capsosiphonis]
MDIVWIVKAKYIEDYQIELTFNEGTKNIVNLKNYLTGKVFEPLKDIDYFKTFKKNSWTIEWDCGADFAPEFLYELAMENKNLKVH